MRVGGIEPVDVREQDQQIRPDARGHDGRERIVVADAEFRDRDGVVLIDDRDRVQLQQALDGVLEVFVPRGVGDIVRRQQDLRDGVAVFREQLVVGVHKLALAHGGRGLLGRHVHRLFAEAQLAYAHADGARGDEDHFVARVLEIAEYLAQRLHLPDVEPPRGVGDGGGADLDDDAHGSVLLPLVSGMEYSTCAGR